MLLVFVPSIGQFVVSDLLGGAKSMLVGTLIQNQFTAARNQPFGSAVAFELMVLVLALLVAAYAWYARNRGGGRLAMTAAPHPTPAIRRASTPRAPSAPSTGRWLLALHTAVVYLFLYAPIAILILFSFNRARQTAVWDGFTLEWYVTLFHDVAIGEAVKNSLIVAVLATLLAILIGTPAGMALARYRFPGQVATRGLLYLPLIIPEIDARPGR